MTSWWLRKVRADEEAWVADHARARRLTLRVGLWLALVLACTLAPIWLPPGPLASACALVVGAWAGAGVATILRRGLAYRSGWLAGRWSMVASMGEAQARGFKVDEWLALEMARDAAVLGVPPPDPPVEPGE